MTQIETLLLKRLQQLSEQHEALVMQLAEQQTQLAEQQKQFATQQEQLADASISLEQRFDALMQRLPQSASR